MATALAEAVGSPVANEGPIGSSMATAEPMTPNLTSTTMWPEDAPGALSDAPSEPASPEAPELTPAAAEAPPPVETRQWNSAEVPDEELEKWVKDDPRLRSRIEQLANNRVGNRLQEERKAARDAAIAEHLKSENDFALATEQFEVMEALAETDPDEYQQRLRNPKVADWRAKYLAWDEQRKAERTAPVRTGPDMKALANQFGSEWNGVAIAEFKGAVKALVPYYAELPEGTRKAIESVQYNGMDGENWFADGLEAAVKGINQYWERKLKTDVEAARQAGQNAALADREEDAPVVVGAKGPAQSAWEIIEAHSRGEKVDQRRLREAYKARGWE